MDAERIERHREVAWLYAGGRLLLAPLRIVAWLGRASFQAGCFFVFWLPTVIAGALFLACGGIVIASVADNIYQYNHDPALRLRQKQAFAVAMRRADEHNDHEHRTREIAQMRPEDSRGVAVETQTTELEKQLARLRGPHTLP